MNTERNTARIAGILFLVALTASLTGGSMLESVLGSDDLQIAISSRRGLFLTGIILEVTNAIAVAGIGILLFPVLKIQNDQVAIGYISLRMLEMVCCLSAAVVALLVFSVVEKSISLDIIDFLLESRGQINRFFTPLFFSLGALILYSFLYRTKLLPRFISVWGLIGVACIVALNILNGKNNIGMLLALPIISNEIFLGIWLIAKGFNQNNLKILYHEMSSD